MNRIAAHPIPETATSDTLPSLDVVILYDDFPAGRNAVRVLANAFDQLDDEIDFQPQLWRFDLLRNPDCFAEALKEARSADVVVLATSAPTGLGAHIRRWLEFYLAGKQGTSGALIALLGPADNPDRPDSPRFLILENLARAAGFTFLAPTHRTSRFGAREGLDPVSPYRYWGINE